MKLKKWLILITVALVLALGVIGITAVASGFSSNLQQLAQTEIHDLDLASARDGDHVGSFSAFPVSATVRVTIGDHAIKRIELVKHDNGQGKGAEVLLSRVVSAQTLNVDCVAGATYSSKVILKAIENALLGAGAKARPARS